MGERPNVVIPSPGPRDRDFTRDFRPWYQQAEEKWWGKFAPQNVRHLHDPEWHNRVWSIQAAHERKGIWKYVAYLFVASQFAGAVWTYSLVYKQRQEINALYRQRMEQETMRWYRETYGK